jgi:exodeoxyribonuclease VII small subunit
MAKTKENADDEPKSFESAISDLDQLVRKLESGTQPLEQMLSDYARAVELVQFCHGQLEGARRRVAQLERVHPDGSVDVSDWDDHAPQVSEATDPPTRRRGRDLK